MRFFRKKINSWLAAIIIILMAALLSAGITAKASSPFLWNFGGRIILYKSLCPSRITCPICGRGEWQEVLIAPLSGDKISKSFVCPPQGFLVIGFGLMPGLKIIGGGLSPYHPLFIGTTP